MEKNQTTKILLVKNEENFWMHHLNSDQAPVQIVFMDATGKSETEDYPMLPLIAGGGSEAEVSELMSRAVSYANEYRATGQLDKDFEIARLRRQAAGRTAQNNG